jgi:hypothetical protein
MDPGPSTGHSPLASRNVGHVSTWSKSDPDKSLSELLHARAASDEARFELARKLGEVRAARRHALTLRSRRADRQPDAAAPRRAQVEGRKRVDFCEAVVCAMDAHVRFFERGRDVASSLEPYIDHSLQVLPYIDHSLQVPPARAPAALPALPALGGASAGGRRTPRVGAGH